MTRSPARPGSRTRSTREVAFSLIEDIPGELAAKTIEFIEGS